MNGCHVALIGRVTKPGELRYTGAGTAFLRVGLMIQDAKRPEDDPPEFANVTIWGETAEQLAERLNKGSEVYCHGRLRLRTWQKQDGTQGAGVELSAWTVQPMGAGRSRPRREAQPHREPAPAQRRMPAMAAAVGGGRRLLDDEGWEPG